MSQRGGEVQKRGDEGHQVGRGVDYITRGGHSDEEVML